MEVRKGLLFEPTFKESNIEYFDIIGIDEENGLVLTKAYPKDGEPFSDSIEIDTLKNALEIGEYRFINDRYKEVVEIYAPDFKLINPYNALINEGIYRETIFDGNMCARCKNRFGGSGKQRNYCKLHCKDKTCQRFKLDK
jgi:hypothetical protein